MDYPTPPENTDLRLNTDDGQMASLPSRLLALEDMETLADSDKEVNAAPLAAYDSGEFCVAMIMLKIGTSEYICCFDPADEYWHKMVTIRADEPEIVQAESSMLGVAKWGDDAIEYLRDLRDHLYQDVDSKPTFLIDIVNAAEAESS